MAGTDWDKEMKKIDKQLESISDDALISTPGAKATPVERAGLTDVLVTGMLIRWIRVSAKPIAIGANPDGARPSVAPMMISRKKKVSTTSATSAFSPCPAPRNFTT